MPQRWHRYCHYPHSAVPHGYTTRSSHCRHPVTHHSCKKKVKLILSPSSLPGESKVKKVLVSYNVRHFSASNNTIAATMYYVRHFSASNNTIATMMTHWTWKWMKAEIKDQIMFYLRNHWCIMSTGPGPSTKTQCLVELISLLYTIYVRELWLRHTICNASIC